MYFIVLESLQIIDPLKISTQILKYFEALEK
jgi:hypothetical protein